VTTNYSKISTDVLRKESFFLNISRVAAHLMSVGRSFHRREAAELKARSPTQTSMRYKEFRICCTAQISLRLKCGDWLQHCRKCTLVQYCPMTGTLAGVSWIRYVQQQKASVNRSLTNHSAGTSKIKYNYNQVITQNKDPSWDESSLPTGLSSGWPAWCTGQNSNEEHRFRAAQKTDS